jgi:hypothetical protein
MMSRGQLEIQGKNLLKHHLTDHKSQCEVTWDCTEPWQEASICLEVWHRVCMYIHTLQYSQSNQSDYSLSTNISSIIAPQPTEAQFTYH